MWKIALAFIVFAAVALFMLSKGGDIAMGGDSHGIKTSDGAASAPMAASGASMP